MSCRKVIICHKSLSKREKIYSALKAFTIFNLAALTEGKNPPNSPIKTANPNEPKTIQGESAKEKASSEKLLKFKVEIVKN